MKCKCGGNFKREMVWDVEEKEKEIMKKTGKGWVIANLDKAKIGYYCDKCGKKR